MVSLIYPAVTMSQPATPLTRRPTLGSKRDSTCISSPSSSDSLASQAKRLRVSFDDRIDVRVLDPANSKSLELVREEVRTAIDGHLRQGGGKDDSAYEEVRLLFATAAIGAFDIARDRDFYASDRPSSARLKPYVIALLGRVHELKGCASLVFSVLDINWFGRDEAFAALYVRFLGALGSASPGFLKPILEKSVRHFASRKQDVLGRHGTDADSDPVPSAYGRLPGEQLISRHLMLSRLHNALRYLLQLIPSSSGTLAEVLKVDFPNHRMVDQRAYLSYIKNMFRVTEYATELRSDVLALITERLVKLDVEVQEEIDDLEEDIEDDLMLDGKRVTNGFDENVLSDESDTDSNASSDLDDDPDRRRLVLLRESVSKLDASMDTLFDHYTTLFARGNRYDQEDSFDHLLSLFVTFVLPTYRSRHTQFLVFHFSQISQRNTARFVSHCLQLATGSTVPSSGSLSSAAYLASFLARGSKVPKNMVRDCVMVLGAQMTKYRRSYEGTARGPDLGRYSLFYAIAQALLYIFCFRWRDLLVPSEFMTEADVEDYDVFTAGEPDWIAGLKSTFTQAVYSRLNPLKVCSPTIVNQFAAIANHLHFMFVYPLLETNKRLKLSSFRSYGGGAATSMIGTRESALSAKSGEAHYQLDAFFPFDPYQLPRSKRWLVNDYNEWKGVPGMKVEEEEEDDDGSEDGSEEDDEEDDAEEEDDVEDDLQSISS